MSKEYKVVVHLGYTLWYNQNYKLHREDGPACTFDTGNELFFSWWIDGKRHREDGPAVDAHTGRKEWWVNGLRHRENGPAVIWPDEVKQWWLNGTQVTEKEVMGTKMTIKEISKKLGYKVKLKRG